MDKLVDLLLMLLFTLLTELDELMLCVVCCLFLSIKNKRMKYQKDKINELATHSKNKNFRDFLQRYNLI